MHNQILATWKAIAFALLLAVGGALLSGRSGQAHERTPREVLAQRVRAVRMGPARSCGSLTIIPVRASGGENLPVRSLTEALHDGGLVVGEIDGGQVNQLYVENRSKSYVFIMAGEILVGAKQNRVLQDDLLLPPQSGRVAVGAYCVQHGRWHYEGGAGFSKSDNVSNPSVRKAARASGEQTQVWDAVAATQRSVAGAVAPASPAAPYGYDAEAAVSASGDLNEIANKAVASKAGQRYREAFADLPARLPDMCGAVVMVRGRVLAADVFGGHALLRALWSPLLASYVLEAVESEAPDPEAGVTEARAFLARVLRAALVRRATPGTGTLVELRDSASSGEALIAGDEVIHLEMFPLATGGPAVDDGEPPLQRSYRR